MFGFTIISKARLEDLEAQNTKLSALERSRLEQIADMKSVQAVANETIELQSTQLKNLRKNLAYISSELKVIKENTKKLAALEERRRSLGRASPNERKKLNDELDTLLASLYLDVDRAVQFTEK